jgi:hypothetical protein
MNVIAMVALRFTMRSSMVMTKLPERYLGRERM